MRLEVTILPCVGVKKADCQALQRDLQALGWHVILAEPQALPQQAYDPQRQQYRADAFLALARRLPSARVLAVTDVDLYAGKLNFVFGMAESPGRVAVISLFRLRLGVDTHTFQERVCKEAMHELGHTLGLRHCANPRCVMRFSNNLADTDRKNKTFCQQCAAILRWPAPSSWPCGDQRT